MRRTILFIAVAIFAIGCKGGDTASGGNTTPGTSSSSNEGKTFTLKFAPKQGDKFNYAMSMDAGPSQKMEMGMVMSIDKVDGDKVTMASTVDTFKMNGTDAPPAQLDMMKKIKNITVMDSTAKTISSTTEGAPAGQTPSNSSNGVTFPPGPIKIGDTWEGSSMNAGKELKAHCKLVKVEAVDGKDIGTIEVTPEGDLGMKLDGPLLIGIEMSNGMTYSVTMKGTAKGPDGKDMPVMMEMKRK